MGKAPLYGVQLAGLVGFGALLEGLRRVSPALALIVGGVLLVLWAVVVSSRVSPGR